MTGFSNFVHGFASTDPVGAFQRSQMIRIQQAREKRMQDADDIQKYHRQVAYNKINKLGGGNGTDGLQNPDFRPTTDDHPFLQQAHDAIVTGVGGVGSMISDAGKSLYDTLIGNHLQNSSLHQDAVNSPLTPVTPPGANETPVTGQSALPANVADTTPTSTPEVSPAPAERESAPVQTSGLPISNDLSGKTQDQG